MFKQVRKMVPVALAGILGSALTLGAYQYLKEEESPKIEYRESTPSMYTQYNQTRYQNGIPADFTVAAEKATPAVVHIRSTVSGNRPSKRMDIPEQFRDFFGDDFFGQRSPQQASGSGVIISQDGYIVTNNHVIDEAEEVEVTLYDKRSFKAKIIGTDPNNDLAVIKIEEKNLPLLTLGNSDEVKVGQWVLAVGNPFNLTSTVTAGIVSAKGRNINILGNRNDRNSAPIESFIQTDAAVNPGNSGGALVNLNGELVGINTAIASQTGSFAGYSFAVPVSIVKKVVDDISKFGSVQRGFLGITITDVNSQVVREKGLKVNDGVYVNGFDEEHGSSAKESGIREGDVIAKVDNVPVSSVPQLQEQIARHRPGDKVKLTVNRDGNLRDFSVTLRTRKGATTVSMADRLAITDALGAELEDLGDRDKKDLKLDGGVRVNRLYAGGALRQHTDMRDGFIITRIDNTPVRSLAELDKVLGGKKGDIVIKGVYPGSDRILGHAFEYQP
jgi:serine protease Do